MNAYNYGTYSYSPSNPLTYNKPNVNFHTRRLITEVTLDHHPTVSHQTDDSYRSESLPLKYRYNDNRAMLIMPYNNTQIFKPPHETYQQKVFVLHKRDSEISERSINSIQKNNMNYIRKAIDYKRKIINRLQRKTRREKYVSQIIEKLATASQDQAQKQNEFSATQSLLKNSRIAREIKAIKVRLEDSMRESTEVCRSFQIKSIEPNTDTISIDKHQIKLNQQKRRNTQPNLSPKGTHKTNQNQSLSFIFLKTKKSSIIKQQLRQRSIAKPIRSLRRHPFRIPFQTYYYRDFLWRINFTNQMFVEPLLEYEHRLKVYVGKGNNSSMVRGLINRRYWFAFTDRLQEANFVWTQLKQFSYFNFQKTGESLTSVIPQIYQYQPRNLMLLKDTTQYRKYSQLSVKIEERGDERFYTRQKSFYYKTIIRNELIRLGKMHNHLQHNYVIGNKKALVSTMTSFYRSQGQDTFKILPLTFHIKMGLQDPTFLQFQKYYHNRGKQIRKKGDENRQHNLWIVKPGQNSNRGNGIHLCLSLQQIKTLIKPRERWPDGSEKTFIVQSYIERPLLYFKRKFDLRHYILITRIKGCLKGYWYQEGYVRTASAEYKLNNSAGAIHLTNDAIQKGLAGYGKYEKGNKLSYADLDNHIARHYKGKGFYQDVYPVMKTIATDVIKASAAIVDPLRLQNNFQLFGLDFMIDNELKIWLIEVNSNPCLELSCPLLAKLIPNLIENVLQMTLDAMYPPPIRYSPKMPRYLQDMNNANKFELVFDERVQKLNNPIISMDQRLMQQQEDTFQDDGSEWEEEIS